MFIPRYVPYYAISDDVFKAYNQLCIPKSAIEKWSIEVSRIDPSECKDTELFIPVWKLKWYMMKSGAFCFLNQALSEAITKDQIDERYSHYRNWYRSNILAKEGGCDPAVSEEAAAPVETTVPASLLAEVQKPKNPSTKKPQRRKKKAK